MNIAFLMGSFDPIHIGHINMIRLALQSGMIDKVIVVPSGHNPWKKQEPASFNLRIEMIEAAIKPFGKSCSVSTIESAFEPPYYANKSLNHFKERYKEDNLFILCGEDTVCKIPKWKDAEKDILPFYNVIVIDRGNDIKNVYFSCLGDYAKKVFPVFGKTLSVSSTEIREIIKKTNNAYNAYPLIHEETCRIIECNNLYKE